MSCATQSIPKNFNWQHGTTHIVEVLLEAGGGGEGMFVPSLNFK